MTALALTLRFACEIALVVAVVWWGWPVAGIVLGLGVIAVWGAFVAPKARRRLRDPLRLIVELALFACATAAYAAVAGAAVAAIFAVLAVATALPARGAIS